MKKDVRYLQLASGDELPALEGLGLFKAILVVDSDVHQPWQWELSRWLIASDCRYAMVWGEECSTWQESVEDALLEAFNYEDIPDEQSVIATSHEDEELADVFWFAKHRAHHASVELGTTLILHIADQGRREELEAAYQQA